MAEYNDDKEPEDIYEMALAKLHERPEHFKSPGEPYGTADSPKADDAPDEFEPVSLADFQLKRINIGGTECDRYSDLKAYGEALKKYNSEEYKEKIHGRLDKAVVDMDNILKRNHKEAERLKELKGAEAKIEGKCHREIAEIAKQAHFDLQILQDNKGKLHPKWIEDKARVIIENYQSIADSARKVQEQEMRVLNAAARDKIEREPNLAEFESAAKAPPIPPRKDKPAKSSRIENMKKLAKGEAAEAKEDKVMSKENAKKLRAANEPKVEKKKKSWFRRK